MPPRPSITSSLAKLSLRGLQTTAPLPPPTVPLPPSSIASSSKSSSTSAALAHLPPIIPSNPTSTLAESLPTDTKSAISLISSQSTSSSGRYVIARLHSRNYLLHPKDILTIPLLKPVQSPGTMLNLSKILEVGSRDYSLRSPASIAPQLKSQLPSFKDKRLANFQGLPAGLVECGLVVMEHTKSPMERILKKKRRKGYKKTIEHKQAWTRLRVGDINLLEGNQASI